MNLGITTSFVVGGLLLLSILHMNITVSNNAMQTTLQMTTKNHAQAISQTISADFKRMGYQVDGGNVSDIINTFENDEISFEANIDSDDDIETISWELTTDKYNNSSNPNIYKLIRTGPVTDGGPDNATTVYPVKSFELTYYDTDHNETTVVEQIDQINVEIVTESLQEIQEKNGNKIYGRSFWQRTFVPPSLHIRRVSN